MRKRVIIEAEPEHFIFAVRAAKSLIESEHKDCGYVFDGKHTFWAKRNKASITVTEEPRP